MNEGYLTGESRRSYCGKRSSRCMSRSRSRRSFATQVDLFGLHMRRVKVAAIAVVLRSLGMVFGRLGVMVCSFLRHGSLSSTRMTYGS